MRKKLARLGYIPSILGPLFMVAYIVITMVQVMNSPTEVELFLIWRIVTSSLAVLACIVQCIVNNITYGRKADIIFILCICSFNLIVTTIQFFTR